MEKNLIAVISKIYEVELTNWNAVYTATKKIIANELADPDNCDYLTELATKIVHDLRWLSINEKEGFKAPSCAENVRAAVADYIYRGCAYGKNITPEMLEKAEIILRVRHAELLG